MTETEIHKPELRKLAPTGILGVLWSLFPAISGTLLIIYIGEVSHWINQQQSMGLILYVMIFAVSAGFGLLPTYAQAVLGGWVFGGPGWAPIPEVWGYFDWMVRRVVRL